ncbi:dTDP-glucose 4,6-dehydratase [candidate division WWE3 bacterium RBG_13_37_7]|uniref:dTDP-glucose 4,6-dehydratase n=1 Tax=candidate division WWE3 bacterium RBG_13_37_7 TaxID=1802609 RepID=A0A1F4U2F5_UNCKA|nr:MAG: dTDP-glucose 4,6-dehydratase [candidate division WWE3 bacterium RBG_13_37_7]
MNILVTGGAGFIGSNFIHYWLQKYPNDNIVNLDALTYAGNLNNLKDIQENQHYKFVKGDIADTERNKNLILGEKINVIVNFAAESHNGRAAIEPDIFLKTNVLGTQKLLEAVRDTGIERFHHISTCEVFGELELDQNYAFKEEDPYKPRTPYNASKAAANHVVMSYFHTYGVPVTISHCSNNYGPYQFPEKVLPRFITNAITNTKLPLFKSSQNKREWTYVTDHCEGIDIIIHKGKVGEAYNIATGIEKSVEEIADAVLGNLKKPKELKIYVEDRPGHDKRYLLDSSKIKNELGWEAKISFEKGLKTTIEWYKQNQDWWLSLLNKGFTENYKQISA